MAHHVFGEEDHVNSQNGPLLKPLLKFGQTPAENSPPGTFETVKGRLLVPRMLDPPRPTSEMVSGALSGRLTGFLRDGKIFRASDLVGQFSAQSAKISLDNRYDHQTRSLLPPTTESTKSLRTLFYIAVQYDELPSFHFWTGPDDPDPIAARQSSDWDAGLRTPQLTEWEKIQQGAKESNGLQIDDDLVSETHHQTSPDVQDQRSPTFKERFGKPQKRTKSSSPPSADDASHEGMSRLDNSPVQPGGLAYARTLHIPGLVRDGSSKVEMETAKDVSYKSSYPSDLVGASLDRNLDVAQRHSVVNKFPGTTNVPPDAGRPDTEQQRQSSVLLRFEWGAMYLDKFSHFTFLELADYLIRYEKDKLAIGMKQRFVDILKPGRRFTAEYRIPGSGRKGSHDFAHDIKPFLGIPDHHYRIRSNAFTADLPFDNSQSGTIKVTRTGVGYCYIDPAGSWNTRDFGLEMENSLNLYEGLKFLFGRDKSGNLVKEDSIPKRLTLEILTFPDAIDFELASDLFFSHDLGEIFQKLTSSQPGSTHQPHGPVSSKYSAEVFVHETGDDFILSEALAPSMEKLSGDEGKEAQGTPNLEQKSHESSTKAEPTDRVGSITTSSTTVSGAVGSSNVASDHSCVRTQSEFEELEDRLRKAEERPWNDALKLEVDRMHLERGLLRSQHQSLEGQVSILAEENDGLRKRGHDLDDQLDNSKLEISQLRLQSSKLHATTTGLRQECELLETRVNDLVEEGNQSVDDIELLRMTVNSVEDQAVQLRKENDHLQSRTIHAEKQANEIKGERDCLQKQVEELEKHASNDSGSTPNGIQKEGPQLPQQAPLQPAVILSSQKASENSDVKKLVYCTVCLASVDKLGPNARSKHAEKCNITENEFKQLTTLEAKELRAARKGQIQSKVSTKDVPKRPTKAENDRIGPHAPVSEQGNSTRRFPKRKRGEENEQPAAEEVEDRIEPPKKKLKSKSGEEAPKTKTSEPPAEISSIRSTRGRGQIDPTPNELEETNGLTQPTSSANATKRPRRNAKK